MAVAEAKTRSEVLTDKLVAGLPPESGIVRDKAQKGFFVIVGKRSRTYYVQYDYRDDLGRRKTKRKALGKHGDRGVTAAKARAAAEEMVAVKEPADRAQADVTLRQAWEWYRDEHLIPNGRAQSTINGYRDVMERLLGDWLDVSLDRLSRRRDEVKQRYNTLRKERGWAIAKHAMVALRAVYNEARGVHPNLPAENPVWFKLYTAPARNSAMALDELPEWDKKRRALPCPVRQEMHLFTLLSALRRETVCTARWEHFDLRRRALHIPTPKGGGAKAFDLPLSRDMVRCLCRARRAGRKLSPKRAEQWVFPSATSASGHITEVKEADLTTGHALRHTWKTVAQQADGVSEVDTMLIMNHAMPGANAGYLSRSAMWPHLLTVQEKVSRFIVSHL